MSMESSERISMWEMRRFVMTCWMACSRSKYYRVTNRKNVWGKVSYRYDRQANYKKLKQSFLRVTPTGCNMFRPRWDTGRGILDCRTFRSLPGVALRANTLNSLEYLDNSRTTYSKIKTKIFQSCKVVLPMLETMSTSQDGHPKKKIVN